MKKKWILWGLLGFFTLKTLFITFIAYDIFFRKENGNQLLKKQVKKALMKINFKEENQEKE